jgi:hypothetical protein
VPIAQLFDMEPNLPVLDRLVTNQREKALLELLSAPQRLGLPVVAPPALPDALTSILRQSYIAMVSSKDYVDEAVKRGFDIGKPNSGEQIAAYIGDTLLSVPAETIKEYREYVDRQ